MKFTTLPTLLSTTKEGFSVAKTCFEHCLGRPNEFDNRKSRVVRRTF